MKKSIKKISHLLLVVFIILSIWTVIPNKGHASSPSFISVAAGNSHNLALENNGTLWAWGGNSYGQLGDHTNWTSPVPKEVLQGVSAIAAGGIHSMAVMSDGTLYTWGRNNYGQLGDGTKDSHYAPKQVLSGVSHIAAGYRHSLALMSDGTLWAWGDNSKGQLGDGTTNHSSTPVQVPLNGVIAIAASYAHSMALKSDGTVWTWGDNAKGQLGDGTTDNSSTPVQVPINEVIAIDIDETHSMALKNDGTLYTWGDNGYGQLGVSTMNSSYTPVQVPLNEVIAIAAGAFHSLALKSDGTLWAWGMNGFGQLGNGTSNNSSTPVQVLIDEATTIASGLYHNLVIKSDGSVWAWGYNTSHQVAEDTSGSHVTPLKKQFSKYSVTFESNGGTAVKSQTVNHGGKVTQPPVPTLTDHTFLGWFTDSGLTTPFHFNSSVGSNITLYAKWELNRYTITFDTNGGSEVDSQTVEHGSTATEPTAPSRPGYTFVGWYADSSLSTPFHFAAPITADTTVYARWSINLYIVSYDGNDNDTGSAPAEQSYLYNSTVTVEGLPAGMTRTGYTFNGWNTERNGSGVAYAPGDTFVMGAENITLYAQWTINNYALSYNGNGNDAGSAPAAQNYPYNSTVTVEDQPVTMTRTGYTFNGWNTAANGSGVTYAPGDTFVMGAENITLYAQWTINRYTVSFDTGGGTEVESQSLEHGSTAFEPAAPTKTGYVFDGWFADSSLITPFDFSTEITDNITLYAKWLSSNSGIGLLSLDDVVLNETVDATVFHYTATVDNAIDVTNVHAVPQDANATVTAIRWNGQSAVNPIDLMVGANVLEIEITAEDGVSKQIYTITVTREASSNAMLKRLMVDKGTLVPDFDPAIFAYSLDVPHETESISVTAAVYHEEATLKINGAAVNSGNTLPVSLNVGTNLVTLLVGAENGIDTTVYTLSIRRTPSSNADLSSLELSHGTLVPEFAADSLTYQVKLPYSVSAITVTASVYHEGATVQVNGVATASGIPTAPITQYVGSNTILVDVTAQDGLTIKTYTITVTRVSPPSNSTPNSDEPGDVQPSEEAAVEAPGVNLTLNGILLEGIVHMDTTETAGRTALEISMDGDWLKVLEQVEQGSTLLIDVQKNTDEVSMVLTGDVFKALEDKQVHIGIATPIGSYYLPAGEVRMEQISRQLGSAAPEQVAVRVIISTSDDARVEQLEHEAKASGFVIIAKPVDFNVTAVYEDRTITVTEFSEWVKREIPLPPEGNPAEASTAVVLYQDGTVRHVPTYVQMRDGHAVAVIHSLTNSTYALVSYSPRFADAEQHWAQVAIHDLASRMIVNGNGADRFIPDAAIKRAEFAAIAIRALGLPYDHAASSFADVHADDWFAGALAAAKRYGLASGYEDGTYRPANTITRQEAVVMLQRMMQLVGLDVTVSDEEANLLLAGFADSHETPAWSKPAVAATVKHGLVTGSGGMLRLTDEITRAETAALIHRLLQLAKLIQ